VASVRAKLCAGGGGATRAVGDGAVTWGLVEGEEAGERETGEPRVVCGEEADARIRSRREDAAAVGRRMRGRRRGASSPSARPPLGTLSPLPLPPRASEPASEPVVRRPPSQLVSGAGGSW
jgi:hypothetical protein